MNDQGFLIFYTIFSLELIEMKMIKLVLLPLPKRILCYILFPHLLEI